MAKYIREMTGLLRNMKEIVNQMTLEEKASLCSGLDFWHTKPIERLGIPSIMVTDGPNGLRKLRDDAEHDGLHESVPATCFPSGSTIACSWDRELLQEVGIALGAESQAEQVSILLGPAVNIKRSPLCGRNFEYYSEDPFLSSQLASQYIQGVQSQGVGTALKHFAANNQEHRRMSTNVIVDERTLREIYLASFETAVVESKPWSVMCAYNQLNGNFCSENKFLLTQILREEWGYTGFVMSDWGAVNRRVDGLEVGLELEIPGNGGQKDVEIVEAVKKDILPQQVLDQAVERILAIIFKAVDEKNPNATYNADTHHKLARKAATESMVLLKNEDSILPLKLEGTVSLIGNFVRFPRIQGGGSAHVQPTQVDDIFTEIQKLVGNKINLLQSDGYSLETVVIDELLIIEAKRQASQADVAVVFVGLPERYESEGYDREHMRIPDNHLRLIEEIAQVQPNIVVVLSNGSPIEMPWIDKVKGVLEGYLGGQGFGGAIADILFGQANPCGKLAETFPNHLNHNPSYLNFPGEGDQVEYREGLYVGYRYYEAKEVEPLFPFGHGLSYTKFEYNKLQVNKSEICEQDTLHVSVNVKNVGNMAGKEIVQLYVRDLQSSMSRPVKELKEFAKLDLKPGEEKTVTFELGKRAFAYYDVELKDWHVETGDFEICIGRSSQDILLVKCISYQSDELKHKVFTRNSLVGDLLEDPEVSSIVKPFIERCNEISGLMDLWDENPDMAFGMMKYMPLRGLTSLGKGFIKDVMIDDLIKQLTEKVSIG